MRVLVYERTNQILNLIKTNLIQHRFISLCLSDPSEIIPKLMMAKYDVALIDVLEENKKIKQIIATIKNDTDIAKTNIICHVKSPSRALIQELISLGVCGFITKPFHSKFFITKFNQIINQINPEVEQKRKHIRVVPKEELLVTYRVPPDYRLVSGKIINISMGGLLLDSCNSKKSLFNIGQIINSAKVKLPKKSFEVVATVVAKKKQFITLKFIQFTALERVILSDYIYNNLINFSNNI